jgi:hypothetical protein
MILGAVEMRGTARAPIRRAFDEVQVAPAPYRADALSRNLQHIEGATDRRIPSAQYVLVPTRRRGGQQNQ